MRADWFSIQRPDENHDYWFIQFTDESLKNDVHIEIEDMRKFKELLDSMIVVNEL